MRFAISQKRRALRATALAAFLACGVTHADTPGGDETDAPDLTGTWLSVDSETRRTLLHEGDRVYGSWGNPVTDIADRGGNDRPTGDYELVRVEGERYEGTVTASWQCWYYTQGLRRENSCTAEFPIELRLVDEGRVEGRLYMPDLDAMLTEEEHAEACVTCDSNRTSIWQGFLWVRED